MSLELKFCKNCVMDGSAEELVLDENGVCNFCKIAQKELNAINWNWKERVTSGGVVEMPGLYLNKMLVNILEDGLGKKYNCLIGLSGGVDSATSLHHAVKLGLRPLCFTMDNGYNDPKADENILKLVETLKVPLYRYVIDLNRFKELQSAFIKAGQKNIEIPTDHILMAVSYEMASKYGIKWIISGGNVASESIMPESWGYQARDLTHIKDIYKWATGKRLKGLPTCGIIKWNWYKWIKGIKTFYLLDYLDYNRIESEKMLIKEYGYKSCGEKHEENIFTRWFQSFYLYDKFSIDKRKAHYSSLINAGQITRDEAREKLGYCPVYPELGIENKVRQYPKRSYKEFKTDEKLFKFISKIVKFLRNVKKIIRGT